MRCEHGTNAGREYAFPAFFIAVAALSLLEGAEVSGTNFSAVNFRDANLHDVNLSKADLTGVRLEHASFEQKR